MSPFAGSPLPRLIRLARARAECLARFDRQQVLKADEWTVQSLPF